MCGSISGLCIFLLYVNIVLVSGVQYSDPAIVYVSRKYGMPHECVCHPCGGVLLCIAPILGYVLLEQALFLDFLLCLICSL